MSWGSVRAAAVATLGLVLLVLLGLLAWGPGAGQPHDARVAVVAPGVASELVADRVSRSEEALRPVPYDSGAQARLALRSAEVEGVLEVDLARTTDVLVLDPARDRELRDAVASRLERLQHSFDRSLDVKLLRSKLAGAPRAGTAERIDNAVLAGGVGGFLLGLFFVVAPRVRDRRLRLPTLGLVPASMALGTAVVLVPACDTGAPWWATAGIVSVTALGGALFTVAFASAADRLGLAVAAGVQLVAMHPVLSHVDMLLMGWPWRQVYPFTMPGAARDLLTTLVGAQARAPGSGSIDLLADGVGWQPFLVFASWGAVLVLAGRVAVRRPGDWRAELPLLSMAGAVAPAAVVLLTAVAFLPTGAEVRAPVQARATTSDCVGVGAPQTVRDLNRITREARGGTDFGGGDVGVDVLLQDHRRLWFFGDTVRRPGPNPRFVRNSMLVFDQGCLAAVLPRGGGAVIPDRSDGIGYWPMSVGLLRQPGYDLVAVGAQRVRATGEDVWDFEVVGSSVALFVVPLGATPQLMDVRDLGEDDADRTSPMWGAASHVDDGWLYVYGTASPDEPLVFGHSLHVARVRPAQVTRPERWTYWDGTQWSPDEESAVELVPADEGTSQTLSVWRSGDTWYALSKQHDFLGSEVVVWTAPAPTGPFTARPAVARLPTDLQAGHLRYMPLAHPELLPVPGTVVVSYSNNRTDGEAVLEEPLRYRPRFLRVQLPS